MRISYNNDPDSYFPSTDPLFGSFFKTRPLLAHPGFVCELFLRLAATLHGLVRSTQSYTFSYKDCKQHLFAIGGEGINDDDDKKDLKSNLIF